ncbi:MAG TPA: tRNA adenosine(34) deaminase TadA [Acidimicrobiales bacterium]|nr:tRNA adenosine(34) deaminase TadA [Acidimicrobiales bacterium]
MDPDEQFMGVALDAARQAGGRGEVPVGAAVVVDGEVIAVAGNRREGDADPTAHAEVLALRAASSTVGTWRLTGATLYVTLEPCAMCAGALVNARVRRVVYGAPDLKAGAVGSLYNLCVDPRLNHEAQVTWGVRADECAAVLREWFAGRRPPAAAGDVVGEAGG